LRILHRLEIETAERVVQAPSMRVVLKQHLELLYGFGLIALALIKRGTELGETVGMRIYALDIGENRGVGIRQFAAPVGRLSRFADVGLRQMIEHVDVARIDAAGTQERVLR